MHCKVVLPTGPASYAQTTVWLAERTRFIGWPQVSAYNMPIVLQINLGYLSIKKCIEALNHIVAHHRILHTRLVFDIERGSLRQLIGQQYTYPIRLSTFSDDNERATLVHDEISTPFDTEVNGVFRCHFIRQHVPGEEDILSVGDLVIFNFHHGSFDGRAMDLFLDELKLSYANVQRQPPRCQYIDYSVHERMLSTIAAENYWLKALKDYGWDRRLELGARQMRSLSARRTDRGSSLSIMIPSEIAHSMITCAHQLNVTLFQLGLACFYLFLTKLSSHNRDACVGIIHLNRYRPELVSMIGMFINVLPCRISMDSLHTLSFIELVYKVQQIFLASVQHAHLPYDQIINLHRKANPYLQLPFLQTVFRVDTLATDYNNVDGFMLSDSCHLSPYTLHDLSDQRGGNKFDLEVSLIYDKKAETIECGWCYMLDVFERDTINMHASRFINLLTQLFGSISHEQMQSPLGKIITIDEEDRDKANKETIDYQMVNLSCPTVVVVDTHEDQELIDRIRTVFSRVLDCTTTNVDVNKSFFEQGGTSLKVIKAVAFLQQDISIQIDIELFLEYPSVAQLVCIISNNQSHFSEITGSS